MFDDILSGGILVLNLLINFVLHIDKHLPLLIQSYGVWTYALFFAIVFCETGLVVVPFLPGDSLLFAAGTFAALGALNVSWVFVVFLCAAILGNQVNYHIGRLIGPKIFEMEDKWFLKKDHLMRTHAYYEKHGMLAIIVTRFMPIIRTFSPFVAGACKMTYSHFTLFNIIGGTLWVSLFIFTGYFFGNIPFIKSNFTMIIYAIVIVSLLPAVIGLIKNIKK
jgi:membrane-associated protein